jgi:phenylpropionate dioxygenase-like ring-hydroxylating dioxygenase large terminal subunit
VTGVGGLANDHPALRAAWHPVARSSEIGTEPVRVTLLGQDWALARLGSGLAAYLDRCPHRLAPLSNGRIEGDGIVCAYHGWCFDADGDCVDIPSLADTGPWPGKVEATTPAGLVERLGLVFLAPDTPVTELLEIPEAGDSTFLHGELEAVTARAGAGLLVDNFLDLAHFPFLHAATIGTDEAAVIGDLDVERHELGMTVRCRQPFPNHEDLEVAAGRRPLIQHRRLTYRYRAPFAVSLRIDYEEAGGTNVVDFHVQPVDAETCRVYSSIHRDDLGADTARLADAVAFERRILDEDLALQERYVDLRLPLDLTTEVHVKADRPTVELRRILASLVGLVDRADRRDRTQLADRHDRAALLPSPLT